MFERCALVAAALLAGSALPAHAQFTQYTITNVGDAVPGSAVGVAGLSDTGFVTGWVFTSGPLFDSMGFRWSPRRTVVPAPPAGIVWQGFEVVDVNDAGTFVGSFGELSGFLARGFRWRAGVSEEFLTPLGFRAFPTAINDAGWIVGYAGAQPAGTPGAVVWDPMLTPSFVADLGRATDINDHEQIVGYRVDAAGVPRGFLYDHGALIPLGSLDPTGQGAVFPRALDNHGRVVGTSSIGGHEHAFLWTAANGMTELPDLGIQHFPFNVAALDINDAGWIVGYAPNSNGQADVLWNPGGAVVDLEPLIPDIGPSGNWQNLLSALRVNAAGQIAGFASHVPSSFQGRTVLLTPAALQASALVPGVAGELNTLDVGGAEPGQIVYLAADHDDPLDRGYFTLATCEPLGLAMDAPRVFATATADGAGHASFQWVAPAGLAGADLRFQAFQRGACRVSNVVRATL
ncbi:MAG: hypothetical protein HZA52_10225 [Planctomycetes bacterium]|nr:hypothetical protein [Planctomycetota bacterium]